MRFRRRVFVLALACLLYAGGASAQQQIKVMTSGAFTAAYKAILPEFKHKTHYDVVTSYGASMGGAPDSIPMRIAKGEPVDVVILARSALDQLVKDGKVLPDSCVDLVRSRIGVAVRAGAPKPDISSVDALKKTLLAAKSVGYSDSASGVYLSTQLFPQLGIGDQVLPKSKRIPGSVGAAIARGEAEIGFQQISELLPVKGIEYVGPLPAGAQKVTLFSAGIVKDAANPDAARTLIEFFKLPEVAAAIRKTGLDPIR